MEFEQGVEAVPELRDAYCAGLRAVKPEYRDRIVCADTRRLIGSMDLDSTFQESLPNDPRWDYGIGVRDEQGSHHIHWVEIHPAVEGNVKEVLKKHAWLKAWLMEHAPNILRMTANVKGYAWVATKTIGFRQGSPKAKQLQTHGIGFPCRRFMIP
jgi:hypothetical protein